MIQTWFDTSFTYCLVSKGKRQKNNVRRIRLYFKNRRRNVISSISAYDVSSSIFKFDLEAFIPREKAACLTV